MPAPCSDSRHTWTRCSLAVLLRDRENKRKALQGKFPAGLLDVNSSIVAVSYPSKILLKTTTPTFHIPLCHSRNRYRNENFFYMKVEFRQLFCLTADNFFIPLSLLIMNELARRGMVSYAK